MTPFAPSRASFGWTPDLPIPAMPSRRRYPRPASRASREWGIGSQESQQISAIAATGASATVGLLVAFGAVTGPIGAAVAGLIAVGQLIAGIFQGCGQTCVQATQIANQAEQALQQNLFAYLGSPTRTASMQAAAINNFNTVWTALTRACGNPALQTAGQNCISQREQGACAYHTSPGGWQMESGTWNYVYPGANGSGTACWNWFIGYLDPIQNDPDVVSDSVVTSSAVSTSGTTSTPVASSNEAPLFLVAAGILLAAVLL